MVNTAFTILESKDRVNVRVWVGFGLEVGECRVERNQQSCSHVHGEHSFHYSWILGQGERVGVGQVFCQRDEGGRAGKVCWLSPWSKGGKSCVS